MILSVSSRKALILVLVVVMGMLLLAACGDTRAASSSSSATPIVHSAWDATAQAIEKMVTFVSKPTAKIVSGTTFEVDGQLKNGDSKQHDITVQATLLDASGKTIATATKLVDNVPGNTTAIFAVKGTTSQPSWSSVQVTVIKVSENINGSGGD
jgi:hypothetical protein